MQQSECDIAIIGGGIAGASIGVQLSETRSVCLLEMEDRAGYHTTGRSAAIFVDFYGNKTVRALTAASKPFFYAPGSGFPELLRRRPILVIAQEGQENSLADLQRSTESQTSYEALSAAAAVQLCPILNQGKILRALLTQDGADIDVDGLHSGYVRILKANGSALNVRSKVIGIERARDSWILRTEDCKITAQIIVNAAGAWCEHIGELAGAQKIGLVPLRRSAALVDPPQGLSVSQWPIVIDADEQFYIKPDAGRLLISPADETPDIARDVSAEEIDIAMAIERVQNVTNLNIRRVSHKWAGLRSFVADRSPVIGYDLKVPNFFWVAALGGFGIQTAPGLSKLAAEILLGESPSAACARIGVDWDAIRPTRGAIGVPGAAEDFATSRSALGDKGQRVGYGIHR